MEPGLSDGLLCTLSASFLRAGIGQVRFVASVNSYAAARGDVLWMRPRNLRSVLRTIIGAWP
jgi:hypothetical protein